MKNRNRILTSILLILTVMTLSLFTATNLEAMIYGSISGKVIAEDTGQGIQGVRVSLCTLEGGFPHILLSAVSDTEGFFQIKMITEGSYALVFVPPPPYVISPVRRSSEDKYLENLITLKRGQNLSIEKSLKVGGFISGHVRREDGATPIEGVEVDVYRQDGSWALPESDFTDSEGKYLISGLEPLSSYVVIVSQNSTICHYPIQRMGFEVEARKTTSLDFVFNMKDPTRVIGQVLSREDGKPPSPDVVIKKYFDEKKEFVWIQELFPDDDGRFEIVGIEPGLYRIFAGDYNSDLDMGDENHKEFYIKKGESKELEFLLDLPSKK